MNLTIGLGIASVRGPTGLPLDAFAGQLYALTGMHRAFSSYTGPICRVRRTSDNAETDIGYTADGWADIGQMLAFAAGGSLTIVRDYDKTGNGHDGLQLTTGAQPRVVLNGVLDAGPNGKPAPVYNGVATYMDVQNSVGFSRNVAATTFAAVAARSSGGAGVSLIANSVVATATTTRSVLFFATAPGTGAQARTTDVSSIANVNGASVATGTWARLIGRARYASGAIDIAVNGATATNAAMTPAQNTADADTAANVRIGASLLSTQYLAGSVATTVLAKSSLDMTALDAGLSQMIP